MNYEANLSVTALIILYWKDIIYIVNHEIKGLGLLFIFPEKTMHEICFIWIKEQVDVDCLWKSHPPNICMLSTKHSRIIMSASENFLLDSVFWLFLQNNICTLYLTICVYVDHSFIPINVELILLICLLA